jgi:hypothetical protein
MCVRPVPVRDFELSVCSNCINLQKNYCQYGTCYIRYSTSKHLTYAMHFTKITLKETLFLLVISDFEMPVHQPEERLHIFLDDCYRLVGELIHRWNNIF